MKKLILISALAFLIVSCREKSIPDALVEPEIHKELYGVWSGSYWLTEAMEDETLDVIEERFTTKLSITIKRITKDTVLAQSVAGGVILPLGGKLTTTDSTITLVLDQPLDGQKNGRFKIKLKKDTLMGTWHAFKSNRKHLARQFNLLKQPQVYNAKLALPTDQDFVDWQTYKKVKQTDTIDGTPQTYDVEAYRGPTDQIYNLNASTTVLEEADLKNLRKLDLEIIRNTIYARHGYAFKNKNARQFFDPIPWYVPTKNNVDQELTTIEKNNIALLLRFEKYATDNYETYGR